MKKVDNKKQKEVSGGAIEMPRYGFGSFRPDFLQRFHTSKWLLIAICLQKIAIGYGLFGMGGSAITTIEKRFGLTYTMLSLFSVVPMATLAIMILPLSHFSNIGHKGRWIGVCGILVAIGQMGLVLSEFVTPPYQVELKSHVSNTTLCDLSPNSTNDDPERTWMGSRFFGFLLVMICQCLISIATATMGNLSQLYIDENVSQHASPMYIGGFFGSVVGFFIAIGGAVRNTGAKPKGIMAAVTGLGVVFGFMLGAMFLRVHTQFLTVDTDTLDLTGPDDPRWIGAWWLGYATGSLLTVLTSVPILGFAPELPDTPRLRAKDVQTVERKFEAIDTKKRLRNVHKQIWALLHIPYYVLQCFKIVVLSAMFSGIVGMMPKMLENYFNLAPSKAAMLIGGVLLPVSTCALILGGYIVRRMRLSVIQNFRCDLALTFVKLFSLGIFFIYCDGPKLAGAVVPYYNTTFEGERELISDCNRDCGCSHYYKPVCNPSTSVVFYSPCYAGCETETEFAENDTSTWSNCHCAPNSFTGAANATSLIAGNCINSSSCTKKLILFFCLLVPFSFIQTMVYAPNQQLWLRIIPMDYRVVAGGFKRFLALLVAMPAQLLTGVIVDYGCLMWHQNKSQKHCIRYDIDIWPWVIFGLSSVHAVLSIVMNITNQILYKPMEGDDKNVGTTATNLDDKSMISNGTTDLKPAKNKNGTTKQVTEYNSTV